MTTKIDKKIIGYEVVKPDSEEADAAKQLPTASVPIEDAPLLKRTSRTLGATYGIKPSAPYNDEAAIYITLNYIEDEQGNRRPIEIFMNSRDASHLEYIMAMTRLISGIFRKGGDVSFVCDELKAVAAANGGFYAGKHSGLQPGKRYLSLVAAIGEVIERFMQEIGYLDPGLSDDFGVSSIPSVEAMHTADMRSDRQSIGAGHVPMTQCPKCFQMTLIKEGGCERCTDGSCNYDKCG